MYIQNATYKTIPTEGLTFPLEAGTVLTVNNITGIVPEKVAVAAPTGVLYLAVGGTIDLTSEANAGITFTDAELNALSGDFNFIPLTESGGSSLPSYTSADKGKALSVGVKTLPPVTTVIIPEQSVTTSTPITISGQSAYYGVVNNANTGAVSTSGEYTLTVDGNDYEAAFTLEQDDSLLALVFDAGVAIRIAGDVCQMITFIDNDTHTIKLFGVVEPKTIDADWASNPLIVKLSLGIGGTYTADKTFSELQEAEESGIPILFSLGRWGIGLAPAEWYDFDSAYTAHLLEKMTSDNKVYLNHGNVSYSENGLTVDWDYRIEMTAI